MSAESLTADNGDAATRKVRRRPSLTTVALVLLTAVAFVPTILVFSKRPADDAAEALQAGDRPTITVEAPAQAVDRSPTTEAEDSPLAGIELADAPSALPFSAQAFADNMNAVSVADDPEPAAAPMSAAPLEPLDAPAASAAGGREPPAEAPAEASVDPERQTAWWRPANAGPSAAGRKYYIVIGSLRDPRRAHALAGEHEAWKPMIVEAEVDGRTRTRVLVGPFHWSDFQTAIARINAAGIPDAWPLPADAGTAPRTLATLALDGRAGASTDPFVTR